MLDARAAIATAMTEDELLQTIVGTRKRPGLAPVYGWLVHHSKPARVSGISWTEDGREVSRWATPVQGDSGLPDLILARDGVVMAWELKAENGKLTEMQQLWRKHMGAVHHVIRPHDLLDGTVERLLKGEA